MASSAQSAAAAAATPAPRPAVQTPPTPPTPKTPAAAVYQSSTVSLVSPRTLSPQSMPLTPPLTPGQAPSPSAAPAVQQQVTRSPPLLQPRPQLVQPIQPQPQHTTQPAIQVSTAPSPPHQVVDSSFLIVLLVVIVSWFSCNVVSRRLHLLLKIIERDFLFCEFPFQLFGHPYQKKASADRRQK